MYLLFLLLFVSTVFISVVFLPQTERLSLRRKPEEHTKLMTGMVLFAFLLLVCFRPLYFRDTESYLGNYSSIQWSYLTNINLFKREPHTGMEYGFVFIELIFKSIGIPFRLLSAGISLFFILSTFKCVDCFLQYVSGNEKDKSDKLLVFLLFLPHFGLFYNLVAIRAAFSFSLLFLGAVRAMKKDHLGTLLLALVAFSVQRLSILGMIPLVLILAPKLRLSNKILLIAWVITGALLVVENFTHFVFLTIGYPIMNLYNRIISSAHRELYDMENRLGLSKLVFLFAYWVSGFPILERWYNKGNSNENSKENEQKFNTFFVIYLMSLLMSVMLSGNEGSYRMTDYLYIYSIPLAYYGLKKERCSTRTKIVIVSILTVTLSFYWGYQFFKWMLYG